MASEGQMASVVPLVPFVRTHHLWGPKSCLPFSLSSIESPHDKLGENRGVLEVFFVSEDLTWLSSNVVDCGTPPIFGVTFESTSEPHDERLLLLGLGRPVRLMGTKHPSVWKDLVEELLGLVSRHQRQNLAVGALAEKLGRPLGDKTKVGGFQGLWDRSGKTGIEHIMLAKVLFDFNVPHDFSRELWAKGGREALHSSENLELPDIPSRQKDRSTHRTNLGSLPDSLKSHV